MLRNIEGCLLWTSAVGVYGKNNSVLKECVGLLFFQVDVDLTRKLELYAVYFNGAFGMNNDKTCKKKRRTGCLVFNFFFFIYVFVKSRVCLFLAFYCFAREIEFLFFQTDVKYFACQMSCYHTKKKKALRVRKRSAKLRKENGTFQIYY